MKKLALALLFVLPLASAKADVYETKNFTINGWDKLTLYSAISATYTGSYTINLTALAGMGAADNSSANGWRYGGAGPLLNAFTAFTMNLSAPGMISRSYGLDDITGSYFSFKNTALDTTKSLSANVSQNSQAYYNVSLNIPPVDLGGVYLTFQSTFGGAEAQSFYQLSPVPEPSSYVMGFAGLLGMIGFASSRKKKAAALNGPALLA